MTARDSLAEIGLDMTRFGSAPRIVGRVVTGPQRKRGETSPEANPQGPEVFLSLYNKIEPEMPQLNRTALGSVMGRGQFLYYWSRCCLRS